MPASSQSVPAAVQAGGLERALRPSRYGRKRATVLALVYVAMVSHMIHWKLAGKTLAPLELNEVMHALELGVITAGFIFMSTACLSVLFFGRFFCSWGCHILALEDLCAWLLKKIHIRPKPIRSRLLLWVPILAMIYMFFWPQIKRLLFSLWPGLTSFLDPVGKFELRLMSDEQGFASFATTDWARNLPGPGIGALTLLTLGFIIVYVLGSRAFCTYGCPYGVIFGFLDRFTPAKIRLKGECAQCRMCTEHCTSNIQVHEEIAEHGMVVSPGCLKDLDCVSVCTHGSLSWGYGKPSLFKSWSRKGREPIQYGLSGVEELMVAATFILTLLVFRGLYFQVPFLLTLGLGSVLGFAVITVVRLFKRSDVSLANLQLKTAGRLTGRGHAFAVFAVVMTLFTVHSGIIRLHEWRGQRAFAAIKENSSQAEGKADQALVTACIDDLEFCHRYGIYRSTHLASLLADIHIFAGNSEQAVPHLKQVVADKPDDHQRLLRLAGTLSDLQRWDEAKAAYVSLLAALESADEAEEGAGKRKSIVQFQLAELSRMLSQTSEALTYYRGASASDPTNADIHNRLGQLLEEVGQPADARKSFRKAIAMRDDYAEPCLKLAENLWRSGRNGEREEARRLFRRVVELDARYGPHVATILGEGGGSR